MVDMKYVYPELLKRAIHMNWLVNPMGSKDGFCGIDWVVELMNLHTKVKYLQVRDRGEKLTIFLR